MDAPAQQVGAKGCAPLGYLYGHGRDVRANDHDTVATMKVSVVVPVYNKGPFLKESFDSIFAQTHADLEVIAIDDRSTDDSLEQLRAIRDPRLRIEQLERNMGHPMATQRGFDVATGNYIVRADADDIHLPHRIAEQVAFMEAHPGIGVSSAWMRTFGAEEVTWEMPEADAWCKSEILFGMPVLDPASIIRTSVMRAHDIRYRPEWPRVGSDRLFFLQFLQHTQYGNLQVPLVRYRVGAQNNNHGQSMRERREEVLRHVFRLLGMPIGQEQFECHLMLIRAFSKPPSAADIRRLRKWVDELIALNDELRLFPQEEFRQRTHRAWDKLFHFLPAHGLAPAMEHIRQSDRRSVAHMSYLAKYTLGRWLGRREA